MEKTLKEIAKELKLIRKELEKSNRYTKTNMLMLDSEKLIEAVGMESKLAGRM